MPDQILTWYRGTQLEDQSETTTYHATCFRFCVHCIFEIVIYNLQQSAELLVVSDLVSGQSEALTSYHY